MQQPPQHRIDPLAIRVWRISGILTTIFLYSITGGVTIAVHTFGWTDWITAAGLIIATLSAVPLIFLAPQLRWRYYRYEISEKEVYIQSGFFSIKRTLIPMVRVQHVNTSQGPVLRRYRLAELEIHTAGGGSFSIPALKMNDADELRDRIGSWVRAAEDE
ncbi:PH domain-containing protein [Paludifilum halophilum]|uniref:PH domain-containing protein n=1 Tax=Paludifilum halophilum TaxID=1642702 RepID=UPI00146F449E|nr:PH domain-containing protein [Paludifilum halophilum]